MLEIKFSESEENNLEYTLGNIIIVPCDGRELHFLRKERWVRW